MRAELVLHGIDAFRFAPVTVPVEVRVDGRPCPVAAKPGGYFILSRALPDAFDLTVRSRFHWPQRVRVSARPRDGILPVSLVPRLPPAGARAVWLPMDAGRADVALGWRYFTLLSDYAAGEDTLCVSNPTRACLEGRTFLLRDTKTAQEQWVTLGSTSTPALTEYQIAPLSMGYAKRTAALLPGFSLRLETAAAIPLDPPAHPASAWLWQDGACRRIELT